jgi:hypothetical protein
MIEITREEYERQERLIVLRLLQFDLLRSWPLAFWAWLRGVP